MVGQCHNPENPSRGNRKKSRSRRFGAIGFKQVRNDAQNVLLPVTRQLVYFFKHAAGFSDRATPASGFAPQESVSRDIERTGKSVNLIGPQRNCFAFPVRNHALRHIGLASQFLLSQASELASLGNPLPQGSARF
jgi:hypothetical protein